MKFTLGEDKSTWKKTLAHADTTQTHINTHTHKRTSELACTHAPWHTRTHSHTDALSQTHACWHTHWHTRWHIQTRTHPRKRQHTTSIPTVRFLDDPLTIIPLRLVSIDIQVSIDVHIQVYICMVARVPIVMYKHICRRECDYHFVWTCEVRHSLKGGQSAKILQCWPSSDLANRQKPPLGGPWWSVGLCDQRCSLTFLKTRTHIVAA